MFELSNIKKNTFYTVVTISSRLFANVFLFWLLARFYKPEVFGEFTLAHTLATTFLVFADFGIEILMTTKLAAERGNTTKIFEKLLGLKIIFLIIATLLMISTGSTFKLSDNSFHLIIIFSLYLIFTSLNNFFSALFKGYELYIFETRVSILANSLLIISTIILLIFQRNIIEIALTFMITKIIGTAYSIYNLHKADPSITFKLEFSGFKLLGGKVIIFGLHLIFSYLFFQVDTLLLAKLKGSYSVGIYQAVFKLVMLPLVIPDIFINSFLPTLSRYFKENKEEWIRLGSIMGRSLFIFALPISVIIVFYAKQIIDLIYGLNDYQNAVNVLKIFGLIILVRFILEPFALMLTTSDRQFTRLITVFTATILNITLNYFVIPKYDVLGASVVSLAVNIFVGFIYIISLKENFIFWLFHIRQAIAIIIVFISGYIFYEFIHIHFIIEIIILLITYIFVGYKFYLTKEEKEILHYLTGRLNILNQR